MTPEQTAAAADALVAATQQSAVQSGQQVEANQAVLAPGLNTGSNAPGGYNYARNVAPVVPVLTSQLVVAAKQQAVRDALKAAQNTAQSTYTDAQTAYQGRQRTFQQKQAERARERQAEEDRRYQAGLAAQAAQLALAQGGIGGAAVGDVSTSANASAGKQYIGNNDLRGRLAYLAKQGDKEAAVALNYVGNDGKYSLNPTLLNPTIAGALNKFAFVNVYKAPAAPAQAGSQKTTPFIQSLVSGGLKR